MYKILLLAAIAVLSFGRAADASTYVITLDHGNIWNSAVTVSNAALSGDIDLSSATLKGVSGVTTASVAGHHVAPTAANGGSYLYVEGGMNSSATFSLSSNSFGFSWGSVDTYNDLKLKTAAGKTYVISGLDLAMIVGGFGFPNLSGNFSKEVDVLFQVAKGTFTQAVLTSHCRPAFEIANVSTGLSSVPLPAALPLFASGIMALVGFAKRRKA
ncbi:MAG: hypothetical protein WC521_07975 [Bdellovibrionales bacterium]